MPDTLPAPEYRPGLPKDALTIAGFQIAMAWETERFALDRATCEKGVAAVFADPSLGQYHVVEIDGEIMGSLLLTSEWSDWRNGRVWWLHSLFLVPEVRGRGIFSGFYRHVQELAASDPGIRGIRLYVDRTNVTAQAVYARLGMSSDHYHLYEWMKPPGA